MFARDGPMGGGGVPLRQMWQSGIESVSLSGKIADSDACFAVPGRRFI
jgi:hypothetical protein